MSLAIRTAEIEDKKKYQLVVAKRNRGGISPREVLLGRDIKTKTQFYVSGGDFLISNRQIVHGACGIVPAELDGALVSNEYSVLTAKKGLLLSFLEWFSHTTYFQQTCFHASVGVDVEKMVFRFDKWLKESFHLPPLNEQRRISEILSSWTAAVTANEKLVEAAIRRKQGFVQVLLSGRHLSLGNRSWTKLQFSKVAELVRDKVDPVTAQKNYRCIELEHIASVEGRLLGWVDSSEQNSLKTLARAGDVLFGKLRPYLRKYLLADRECVCSSEIWVLRPNAKLCAPEFLFYLVQSAAFIRAANVSAGSKMPRADWDVVSALHVDLPPLDEQARITRLLITFDEEISLLRARNEKLKVQIGGVLNRLLAGSMKVTT